MIAARYPSSTKTSWNGVSEVYGPRQSVRVDTSAPITWSYGIRKEKPLSSVARREPRDDVRIGADLGLGERDADLHEHQYGDLINEPASAEGAIPRLLTQVGVSMRVSAAETAEQGVDERVGERVEARGAREVRS